MFDDKGDDHAISPVDAEDQEDVEPELTKYVYRLGLTVILEGIEHQEEGNDQIKQTQEQKLTSL